MAWLAVNKDETETIFTNKPMRVDICGFNIWDVSTERRGYYINIPKGSIKKLIGRELNWEDEPVELK